MVPILIVAIIIVTVVAVTLVVAVYHFYLPADLAACRVGKRVHVRIGAPARMAAMTRSESFALSCWLAVHPAITFAAVIVPVTVVQPPGGTRGRLDHD